MTFMPYEWRQDVIEIKILKSVIASHFVVNSYCGSLAYTEKRKISITH